MRVLCDVVSIAIAASLPATLSGSAPNATAAEAGFGLLMLALAAATLAGALATGTLLQHARL